MNEKDGFACKSLGATAATFSVNTQLGKVLQDINTPNQIIDWDHKHKTTLICASEVCHNNIVIK